jgi:AraC-like DNA-binding protein
MSLFRKSFGISIGDYITQYRIAHAQRLLVTTTMNVSEIALDSGFGSVSRFYTAFKQVCEMSPGAYRAALHFPL